VNKRSIRNRYVYLVNRYGSFGPFLLSLVLLLVIFYGAVVGFMLIEDWSLSDAFYMAIITLSTVGFTEVRPLSTDGRLFVGVVIVLGVGTFMFMVASLSQFLIEGQIHKLMGRRRVRKSIDRLTDHYIVCGYGRIGRVVVEEIRREGHPVVVIEQAPEVVARLEQEGELHIAGDATADEVLVAAGVERASAVITALTNDAANVFVVLTARQVNPDAFIVARTSAETHVARLERAGADRVVMPHQIGGIRMAQSVLRPTVTSFVELARESNMDLQMEEVRISPGSIYVGRTMATSGIRSDCNIIVLAIKRDSGAVVFNPSAGDVIQADDVLLAVGEKEGFAMLRERA
jgi:voltage-gated potassium channel